MTMNTNYLLAGQTPDFLGTINKANQAAQFQNVSQRQNALAGFNQQHGAEVMAGDTNALNRYAQLAGPEVALGIQGQRQSQEVNRAQIEGIIQSTKIEAAKWVVDQDDATKAEREKIMRRALTASHKYWKVGDEQGMIQSMAEFGIPAGQITLQTYPEVAAQMTGVIQAIGEAEKLRDGFADPVKPSAAEQQISRIMETGVPREVAIKIADGVYRLDRDATTREVQVLDLASGQIVFGNSETDQSPELKPRLTFGEAFTDTENAFGAEGFGRNIVNTAAGAIGADLPFPETQKTQNDFANLREGLINQIASSYGRQPPSWLLKNIEKLTPVSGKFWSGSADAESKLESIGRDLERSYNSTVRQLSERTLSPTLRQELQTRLSGLKTSLEQVEQAINSFDPAEQQTTSTGLKWRVVE